MRRSVTFGALVLVMRTLKRMNNTADRMKIIVDAAAKLFAEKGYYKTTVDEIAANSGVVRGTVLHYFSCKERLFNAVLDSLEQETMAAVSEAAENKNISAEEAVLEIVNICMDRFSTLKPNDSSETDIYSKRYYIDAMRLKIYYKTAAALAEVIKRGSDEGLFDVPNPKARAESVLFAVFGIIGAQLSEKETDKEIRAVLKDMLGIK